MEMMGKRRCILAHPKACSIAIRHSNENVDFRILKYFNYRIILHSALHHVLLLSQRCVTYLSFQQRTHETPRGVVFINSAYKNLLTDVMAVANHGAQFSLIAILIIKGQLRAPDPAGSAYSAPQTLVQVALLLRRGEGKGNERKVR